MAVTLNGEAQVSFPDGILQYVVSDDFSDGVDARQTEGEGVWYLVQTSAADTILVADDYVQITAYGSNRITALFRNRGFKLNAMKAGAVVRFECKFLVSAAATCDLRVGVGIHDSGGYTGSIPADFCNFVLTNGSTTLTLVAQKDSSNSGTPTIGTIANATQARVAFEFKPTATPSTGTLTAYFNGTEVYSATVTTFPDDVFIFPMIEVKLAASGDYARFYRQFTQATMTPYVAGTP